MSCASPAGDVEAGPVGPCGRIPHQPGRDTKTWPQSSKHSPFDAQDELCVCLLLKIVFVRLPCCFEQLPTPTQVFPLGVEALFH